MAPITFRPLYMERVWGGRRLAEELGKPLPPEKVIGESWELVERGHLDAADFRAFTFGNPVALWAGTNPGFFAGTVVEDAVSTA